MPKILCPCYECVHHAKTVNKCMAKEISLREGHWHTLNEGLQQFWQCKSYEPQEWYKIVEEGIKGIYSGDYIRREEML